MSKKSISISLFVLGTLLLLFALLSLLSERAGDPEALDNNRVLLIASETNLSDASSVSTRNKLDVFRDILTSHWNLTVDVADAREVRDEDIHSYGAVFVINTDFSPFPEELRGTLERARKLALIGYSIMDEGEVSTLADDSVLEHEGVEFLYKGAYIFPDQPIDTEEFIGEENGEVLARVVSDTVNIPFIIQSGDRMFISLNVPNYYETDSHSTILLSAVERFLGFDSGRQSANALIRLEDINPFTYGDTEHLSEVFELLVSRGAGFNLAVIPQYLNPPLGTSIALSERPDLAELLREYNESGAATLIQHGYTHQTGEEESAVGFEFWDIDTDTPLPHDSRAFVEERVELGRAEMEQAGLPIPTIWETPHYALSELDEEVINELFRVRYERTREFGGLPFVVTRTFADGSTVTFIPENLNYIGGEEDMIRIEKELRQLGTVSTSTPSFFWHPWRDVGELLRMLELFEEEGYVFITAEELLKSSAYALTNW